MRDSERRKISASMDDLVIRTVGMMDTFPSRFEKLESHLRELEMKFSTHEGEQMQGIKRISDRIDNIEKMNKDLYDATVTHVQEIRNEVNALKTIEGLTEEQKTIIQDMNETLKCLLDDYNSRQNVKKTAKEYITTVLSHFVRYSMLPLTIAVLLYIGFSPEMIPGYRPWRYEHINTALINSFNQANIDLQMICKDGKINESGIRYWMFQHDQTLFSVSDVIDPEKAPIRPGRHFFIWLPKDSERGYIQVYNDKNRKIGSVISVVRGK